MNVKKNKFLKIGIIIIVIIAITCLIKANVTFSKEPNLDEAGNFNNRSLEINSDLVREIYAKLTLLNDSFLNENYKYTYFKMSSKEKELSPEEKFYITVENLYEIGKLDIIEEDGKELITIGSDFIIDEANKMFKGSNLDAKNINFAPMSKCGITDYLFTGSEYKFTITKCTEHMDISKNKLVSARKEKNFVILRLKSFYATYVEKNKKEKEGHYLIKNFNDETELASIPESDIEDKIDRTYDEYGIFEFDFYFELIGDDYYLAKIAQVE